MNGFWVFAEHSGGAVERVTFELLGEARRLAREAGTKVAAVIFGDRVEALTAPLAHYRADTVYLFEDERLRRYDPGIVAASLGKLCAAEEPALVLFSAEHYRTRCRGASRHRARLGVRRAVRQLSSSGWGH